MLSISSSILPFSIISTVAPSVFHFRPPSYSSKKALTFFTSALIQIFLIFSPKYSLFVDCSIVPGNNMSSNSNFSNLNAPGSGTGFRVAGEVVFRRNTTTDKNNKDSDDFENNTNCLGAPTPLAFKACLKLSQLDRKARQSPLMAVSNEQNGGAQVAQPFWIQPSVPIASGSRGQTAFDPRDCMTLQCLCPHVQGVLGSDGFCRLPQRNNEMLGMAVRKEYRMLSDAERSRFHSALQAMKASGEFDRFANEHLMGSAGGAHSGPAFLPWHREFLKRFEIALRLYDPSIAVPYWDSVMDNYLPNPADSIFFSADFAGESDWTTGAIVSGAFTGWPTIQGNPGVRRLLGASGRLFNEYQLIDAFRSSRIEDMLAFTVPRPECPWPANFGALEYAHVNIHFWIGGDMGIPETSANDPLFYSHHSFVDLVWETWRQLRQSREQREWNWPTDSLACSSAYHFRDSVMWPYSHLSNRDGLSNGYTDQLYRFAPRPTCSAEAPNCGSKYLFCDLNHGYPHCVAKIKLGGLCAGFERQNACYESVCVFGRCVPGASTAGRPVVSSRLRSFSRGLSGMNKRTRR